MYQQESFWNAFKRGFNSMPLIIRSIIAVNAIIFMIMALGGQTVSRFAVEYFGFNPSFSTAVTQPWRIITYMFLHGGGFHVLFNMLWLWWMGRMVEETVGPRTFTVFYFGAGIGGALLQIALAPFFGSSMVIGASGAVLGIMVAFAYLFPTAPVMLLFFPPIQARFFVAGWVALDVLFIGSNDNIARLVHLGGAGIGFLLVKAYSNGADLTKWVRPFEKIWNPDLSKSKKKKPKNKKMYSVSDVEIVEESNQTELDDILEKISQKGYDGLTAEEKKKLFELSKKN